MLFDIVKQGLDEIEQVVDLFQFAPTVLVHLAVAGQDMQGFEQVDRLIGADVVGSGHEIDGGRDSWILDFTGTTAFAVQSGCGPGF